MVYGQANWIKFDPLFNLSAFFAQSLLAGIATSSDHYVQLVGKAPCTLNLQNTIALWEGFPPQRYVEGGIELFFPLNSWEERKLHYVWSALGSQESHATEVVLVPFTPHLLCVSPHPQGFVRVVSLPPRCSPMGWAKHVRALGLDGVKLRRLSPITHRACTVYSGWDFFPCSADYIESRWIPGLTCILSGIHQMGDIEGPAYLMYFRVHFLLLDVFRLITQYAGSNPLYL